MVAGNRCDVFKLKIEGEITFALVDAHGIRNAWLSSAVTETVLLVEVLVVVASGLSCL